MRQIISIFILIVISLPVYAQKAENTGAWSEKASGIQGRLIITEGGDFIGTKLTNVYVELKNISDVGNPIEIYFNPYRVVQCHMLDPDNKPLEQFPTAASIVTPPPFWLTLPYDGLLRFRVSVSGYGIPKNGGTIVQMPCGVWLIKADDIRKYGLEVTFASYASEEDKKHQRAWKGVLKLPKVEIRAN